MAVDMERSYGFTLWQPTDEQARCEFYRYYESLIRWRFHGGPCLQSDMDAPTKPWGSMDSEICCRLFQRGGSHWRPGDIAVEEWIREKEPGQATTDLLQEMRRYLIFICSNNP
ncbi:hypothetical protein N7471_006656 [Penicillium samsonianum]|uniref:uncharacterized protein n=1 Tax=Penicillium samsonianum TaxID=1882272 RepID=UPI0025498F4E|nr:uncharacterized protein N7471_006656 [Penicillium samsonianum]KAJ6140170.1 hypothetical protein N7471_006656 [Penicillium samsonianum]